MPKRKRSVPAIAEDRRRSCSARAAGEGPTRTLRPTSRLLLMFPVKHLKRTRSDWSRKSEARGRAPTTPGTIRRWRCFHGPPSCCRFAGRQPCMRSEAASGTKCGRVRGHRNTAQRSGLRRDRACPPRTAGPAGDGRTCRRRGRLLFGAEVQAVDQTVDIALPRRERSVGVGHRDFEVESGPASAWRRTLARRDFRMNMLARRFPRAKLSIPTAARRIFGRAASICFPTRPSREDPLRMLRAAQFAARFEYAVPNACAPP